MNSKINDGLLDQNYYTSYYGDSSMKLDFHICQFLGSRLSRLFYRCIYIGKGIKRAMFESFQSSHAIDDITLKHINTYATLNNNR